MPQAARLAGIPRRTLYDWARTLVPPSDYRGSGRGHWSQFSFADVVAIRTIAELRKAGASLQCLRSVAEYLKTVEGLDHPFAQARLVVRGKEVLLVKGDREAWGTARRPGQRVFGFVLDLEQIAKDLREDAQRLAEKKAIA